jgi:hypothetical protein
MMLRSSFTRIPTAAILGLVYWVSQPVTTRAHHPHEDIRTPHQRIDVIGPVGNRLPMSYRRKYNRPTDIGGKISYWFNPTSQEAMAWHKAEHAGLYDCKAGKVVNHYFYPKPWEMLQMQSRGAATNSPSLENSAFGESMIDEDDAQGLVDSTAEDVSTQNSALSTEALELDADTIPPVKINTSR